VLLRGTAIVSLLTLLSRILGFGRDLLVARLLGASLFADAFFVAFRIPNLLRSFVAEGALTSAFTPVFADSLAHGKDHAREVFRKISGFLLLITTALTLLLITYSSEIVAVLAPGFLSDTEQFSLCVRLTQTMAPYIACVSLIAMLNAALNTLHIFGTSAWAQVIMNIVLIIGALTAIPFDPRTATLIAAQIPACTKAGLSLTPSFSIFCSEVQKVVALMLPAILGASVYQISMFLATVLASLVSTGSVSWLFYADRVAQFPIGIFSIALASVLLPALANASAKSDRGAFDKNIANSLRYTSFCIIPMSAGIWALALPITRMLFERGEFSAESSVQTALALQALCLGLWAMSCHSMIVRAFIARKDTVTPTLVGIASLLVNVIASLLLMGSIKVSDTPTMLVSFLGSLQRALIEAVGINGSLGHVGLALASSIAAGVSLCLVIIFFCVRIRSFPWRAFVFPAARATIASLLMVYSIQATSTLTQSPSAACALGITTGAVTFFLASWLLRSSELRDAMQVVRAKLVK
jgi:putative peptidoglycan lipid II flippase